MPVCFGISFTKTPMNQARSLVHVYTDGSVAVSTGAVEMGQGVNTKIAQVAAEMFSACRSSASKFTRPTRFASPTHRRPPHRPPPISTAKRRRWRARRSANGLIEVAKAAGRSRKRRRRFARRRLRLSQRRNDRSSIGKRSSMEAHLQRVNLSEHAHYATPGINFDWGTAKGHPFAYHVYGTAIVGVTVDCLRGRYEVDYVKCCHDFGSSMNTSVDHGQIEGGIVQGIGWMTMEEVVYDADGKLRSNALSTYKVPDIYSVPKEIAILPLETDARKSRHLQLKSRRRTAADVRHRRVFCDSRMRSKRLTRNARRDSTRRSRPKKC